MPRVRIRQGRGWGRRVSDRVRPVVMAAVTSLVASSCTAGVSYLWQQTTVQELNTYWHSYWRACGIKRE